MKGSNSERRASLRENIERKLEILEAYNTDGVPEGFKLPKSILQFRMWDDAEAKVYRISSPNSLNAKHSPHNIDLIERLVSLISKLQHHPISRKKSRRRVASVDRAAENVTLRAKLSKLGSTLHELRNEVLSLKVIIAAKDADLTRLQKELVRKKTASNEHRSLSLKLVE